MKCQAAWRIWRRQPPPRADCAARGKVRSIERNSWAAGGFNKLKGTSDKTRGKARCAWVAKYFAQSSFIRYFRCDLTVNDCHAQRTRFAARLPAGHVFTSSHFWFVPGAVPGRWRVGVSEFALRMLGDLVVVEFDKKPGDLVALGEAVGLIEGFKAISDLYCIGSGTFHAPNPILSKSLEALDSDPYGAGWLYEFTGEPGPAQLDAAAYAELLGVTINRIHDGQCAEKITP